jgi:Protein of unknown function (DUF5818)
MKSDIKQFLFVGMSFALVALTVRRHRQDTAIEGDVDSQGRGLPGPTPPVPGPTDPTASVSGLSASNLFASNLSVSSLAGSALFGPGPSRPNHGDHTGTAAPILGDQPGRIPPGRFAMAAPTVMFSGTVVRSGPRFALRESAGVLYPLDSAGRAWPYEGEDVRVTGKLDLDTQLLYVDAIEPAAL